MSRSLNKEHKLTWDLERVLEGRGETQETPTSLGPRLRDRFSPRRKRMWAQRLLPVMEDGRVVGKDNAGDVSSPKKPLQRGWWERLGLVGPPEDHGRDASPALLQGA